MTSVRTSKSDAEKVVVALSGGPSSCAMLELFFTSLKERKSNRNTLFSIKSLIYIDESTVLSLDPLQVC